MDTKIRRGARLIALVGVVQRGIGAAMSYPRGA